MFFILMCVFLELIKDVLYWAQFDEQKDQVAVEQILRVVFIDPQHPSPVSIVYLPCLLYLRYKIVAFTRMMLILERFILLVSSRLWKN